MSVLDWWETELQHLTAFACSWTHDQDDAEDVVQEAVLRTWLAERRGQEVTRSYAFRAVRTICIDRARSQQRLAAFLEHGAPLLARSYPAADSGLPPDTLDGLTPRQRPVMEAYLRGDRLRETSDDLGLTERAVQKLRWRACQKLRTEEQAG